MVICLKFTFESGEFNSNAFFSHYIYPFLLSWIPYYSFVNQIMIQLLFICLTTIADGCQTCLSTGDSSFAYGCHPLRSITKKLVSHYTFGKVLTSIYGRCLIRYFLEKGVQLTWFVYNILKKAKQLEKLRNNYMLLLI